MINIGERLKKVAKEIGGNKRTLMQFNMISRDNGDVQIVAYFSKDMLYLTKAGMAEMSVEEMKAKVFNEISKSIDDTLGVLEIPKKEEMN